MLDRFALGCVVTKEPGGCAFATVEHEVDECSARVAGCAELDRAETIDHRKHGVIVSCDEALWRDSFEERGR